MTVWSIHYSNNREESITTSHDLIVLFFEHIRKQFWKYYLPSKFHCHSVNALEVTKRADTKCLSPHLPSTPQVQELSKLETG